MPLANGSGGVVTAEKCRSAISTPVLSIRTRRSSRCRGLALASARGELSERRTAGLGPAAGAAVPRWRATGCRCTSQLEVQPRSLRVLPLDQDIYELLKRVEALEAQLRDHR